MSERNFLKRFNRNRLFRCRKRGDPSTFDSTVHVRGVGLRFTVGHGRKSSKKQFAHQGIMNKVVKSHFQPNPTSYETINYSIIR
jgi:hypothetical protein